MNKLVALVLLVCSGAVIAEDCQGDKEEHCPATTSAPLHQDADWSKATTIYDFHARDIHGNDVSLDKYRGHVCVIVNVASNCGLTDTNYKELEQLYEKYSEKEGLRILAFPSNQFGGQEPGTSEQILDFVKKYNVTFDMFEKVDVNGEGAHPLWKWIQKQKSGILTDNIKWNFTKFIVDKEGKVVERYAPTTEPIQLEAELQKYF